MRAEQRHRLKTNELAESLGELAGYVQTHGRQLGIGVTAAIVLLVGAVVAWKMHVGAVRERAETLTGALQQADFLQIAAARAAQVGPEGKEAARAEYDTAPVEASLRQVSEGAGPDGQGLFASLKRAELLRSRLYFGNQKLTEQEREGILSETAGLYQQVAGSAKASGEMVGMARLGLALVAEEQRQWEEARKEYEAILGEQSGRLVGTIYPELARRRLEKLGQLAEPVTFAPGSTLPLAGEQKAPTAAGAATPTMAPAGGVGSGGGTGAPAAVVPPAAAPEQPAEDAAAPEPAPAAAAAAGGSAAAETAVGKPAGD